ncbi:MAG: 3-oxoacyl-ACP reductase FabG [Mariprofundaceae bacterium]
MAEQRVAMVSGASRGIGLAIAEKLAGQGYALALCATRQETLELVAEKLRELGGTVTATAVDVSDKDAVQGWVRETAKSLGSLDVLVNNAGITKDNLSMRMKDDEWHQVIATNLNSVFFASRAALRFMMKARYGRIINVSSVVACMGNPGQVNYCASKGGVEAFTRSLAREVGSRGITVNAIAPGFISTDMTAELSPDLREALIAQVPIGRLGLPEDIAAATAFLASKEAGYISGQVMHVNGGMYM